MKHGRPEARSEGFRTTRRRLAAEVVQTSAMDCGPAALKSILEGFGVPVSYGRLREACHTDVDGTSIDTLEDIALSIGLDAVQTLVPVDNLLLPEAASLPALVVTRLASGFTHFVVIWRRYGRWVEVMDPASGRRWLSRSRLERDLYIHSLRLPATAAENWLRSEAFCAALRARLVRLDPRCAALVDAARAGAGWYRLAILDAATRLTAGVVEAGGARRGRAAAAMIDHLLDVMGDGPAAFAQIPEHLWTARPADATSDGTEDVLLRGAVVLQVAGARVVDTAGAHAASLSPELAAALDEPSPRPARELVRMLVAGGPVLPASLLAGICLAAAGVIVEGILFRQLFELGRTAASAHPGVAAPLAIIVALLTLLVLVDIPITAGLLALGRRLEGRIRGALVEKISRLHDRYVQSRPISDMAHRSHGLYRLRLLPQLGGDVLRSVLEVVATTAGIIWLVPAAAPLAAVVAVVTVLLPLILQPPLAEQDVRLRTHEGALARFSLDALLGLVPLRAHGAERSLHREHEAILGQWLAAGTSVVRTLGVMEAVQAAVGLSVVVWLLGTHLGAAGSPGSALLLLYWALSLPALGYEISLAVRQYPACRTTTLRALEPLGALEDETVTGDAAVGAATDLRCDVGVDVVLQQVRVVVGGHQVLDGVDLHLRPGEHVAVVGASGAGKSTLAGLLLGWYRPAGGRLLVDGRPLTAAGLRHLRRQTAWVDPQVQLWNRSLVDNLRYGAPDAADAEVHAAITTAHLDGVIGRLPQGIRTPLGDGGALLSGGEGQRVRFGRALLRGDARLVVLDEPFRGLARAERSELLVRAREVWRASTMLCVTHDVVDTRGFDRVIVIDGGAVVEEGVPGELLRRPRSRYATLVGSQSAIRDRMGRAGGWREVRLTGGRLETVTREVDDACAV